MAYSGETLCGAVVSRTMPGVLEEGDNGRESRRDGHIEQGAGGCSALKCGLGLLLSPLKLAQCSLPTVNVLGKFYRK